MTEKRFTETISTGIVTDNFTGKEYNCEYRIDDELLKLLNEQHETITKLKSKIQKERKSKEHFAFICDCAIQVMNDEKELKKDYLKISAEENFKLAKQNEQLKQQEKRLYKYFRKCFENVSEQGFRETWEVVKKYG